MVNYSASLDRVFAALGDPTRQRIVERLARESLTIGQIAAGFSMSAPAITKHVKVLERSGVIAREVVGRVHRCRLQPRAMHAAATWAQAQERFWMAALDRLADELATSPKRKRKS
jgi:DNA-binding transcriptional ArsR family regulator